MPDASRAQFDASVRSGDLVEVAKDPRLRVLQCCEPVPDRAWRDVDRHVCAVRPDVEIRVYGHYSTVCDLSFAALLQHVRRFAADCLTKASGLEAIGEIPDLESLSLGIFELRDLKVLDRVSPDLVTLRLGRTRSKRPDLGGLDRFEALKTLYIEGHSKGIDSLAKLERLEQVTLRSITTPDLSYLSSLPMLRSLDIKLGGIRSFEAIRGMANLAELEVWRVLGFSDLGYIEGVRSLEALFLQDLPRVVAFPPMSSSASLRQVFLENLKGLQDFTPFEKAPALEEFSLTCGNKQTPEQLLPVLRNPHVRRVCAGFGSDRKNREFERLREEYGKEELRPRGVLPRASADQQ